MSASKKLLFHNILRFPADATEDEIAKAAAMAPSSSADSPRQHSPRRREQAAAPPFPNESAIQEELWRCPEVQAAIAALKSAGAALSARLPDRYIRASKAEEELDLLDYFETLFCFQADNVRNQREHVVLLLANHILRRPRESAPPPSSSDGSAQAAAHLPAAVTFLHDKLLENYRKWCAFLRTSHYLEADESDNFLRLAYPCLYLLIWGEAANLRFMPECLCFIFHHVAYELNRATELRRHDGAADERNQSGEARIAVTSKPFLLGENKSFLMTVIQPIYNAIRAEAEASKNGVAPHSSWRNYDDMNEFFWSGRCFTQLRWPFQASSDYFTNVPQEIKKEGSAKDLSDTAADPLNVLHKTSNDTAAHTNHGHKSTSYKRSAHGDEAQQSSQPIQRTASQRREEQRKRKFVRRGKQIGFKAGFVEQRSFWSIFQSFHRLWAAQFLILQALLTLAFSAGNRKPWISVMDRDIQFRLCYLFVTWAALRAIKALLSIVTQFSLISRSHKLLAFRMVLKLLLSFAWLTVFCLLLAQVHEQRIRDGIWSAQANVLLLQFLLSATTFVLPDILAIVFLLLPWLANIIHRSDSRVLHVFAWWFHVRIYVGRGMHQSLSHSLKYILFWLVVLMAKIAFSYFLQIIPMVEPTRQLFRLNNVQFRWHEFFSNHNRFVVACLWAPVILVYLMDTQIWFSIVSALVGAMVGLSLRIGEVRNLHQFRLRFHSFQRETTFKLLSEKQKPDLPDLSEARKFAYLWNYIITCFREEDVISNKEVEWLKIQEPLNPALDIAVPRWPLVLLANEVAKALLQAKKRKDKSSRKLWEKISSTAYKKNVLQEIFYSLRELLEVDIWVKDNSNQERDRLKRFFHDIEKSCMEYKFLEEYKASYLEHAVAHCQMLLVALLQKDPQNEDAQKISIIKALLNLIDGLERDFPEQKEEGHHNQSKEKAEDIPAYQESKLREERLFEAVQVPNPKNNIKLARLSYLLDTKETMVDVPRNLEAGRRLAFFCNSVFMAMPPSPLVKEMLAFSVLTPYYNEDVLYTQAQLLERNEDGIDIYFYLQQIFPDEWANQEEREGKRPEPTNQKWASYRGQTLARTVRGMMYYQRALELLSHLQKEKEAFARGSDMPKIETPNTAEAFPGGFDEPEIEPFNTAAARLKFTFIVACQEYDAYQRNSDQRAHDINSLLQENPTMRIAYVSKEGKGESETFHSILAKYDHTCKRVVNIYDIQLPGPFVLGEGKPENQNQAIIFTRGEALQTIDMNQDFYFEEALKVRNLLQEFHQGKNEKKKPRILGIREHVFTGSVSSLASFMSAQETSFVTLCQRVFANPLRIRMHYGHPDMFDRLWFLTRGGLGKASKAINVSEDIYAGFSCTLRGGHVTHNEYIQVGKGRDLGLNQITAFEAKISGGNGEQMLSRDVYRLGHRLDFFRMLSFYYTSVGFYISSLLVILAAFAFMWGRAYLGLSGIEEAIVGNALENSGLLTVLSEQMVLQIGLFSSFPMIVENSLEWGFSDAAWQFLIMQLQLCAVFYTFTLGTKAYYFGRTLLHGGAIYQASGRSFVVKREPFVTIYCQHSRSHFIKAVELIILLLVYAQYSEIGKNNKVYALMTLSFWFLALGWLLAPFLFNPSGFDWLQTVYDYESFQEWLWRRKGVSSRSQESWEGWWNQQQDHLNDTGLWGRVTEVLMSVRFGLIQYGMVYRLKIAAHNKSILVYFVSWTCVAVAIMVYIVVARAKDRYGAEKHTYYRAIQVIVTLFVVMVIVLLVELTEFKLADLFLSMLGFLPTGWGLLCVAAVFKPILEEKAVWEVIVGVARLYELALGLIVLVPVAVLSWLPGFRDMQTRILFNQAFSRGLQISKLLSGKKAAYRGSY